MTAQTIRDLVRLLPPGLAYSSNCLHTALFDPAFPWHFVRTFVDTKKPLPIEVRDVLLRKAYAWQVHGRPNPVLEEAYELTHPANHQTTSLLNALLICPDLSLEKIAGLVGLPQGVVEAYWGLFWNVRDRLEDRLYLARLVYPDTRYPGMETDALIPQADKLLQAAYEHGSEELLYMAGLKRRSEREEVRNTNGELEKAIMDNAMTLVRHGALNKRDVPGLRRAQGLMVAKKKDGAVQSVEGMPELTSIGEAMFGELLTLAPDEIRSQLQAQRNLEMGSSEEKAEAAQKSAS